LCTGSHDFRSEAFDLVVKPIEIGEGSWIAAGVFVGPGVVIGKNTFCVAGAVVVRDAGPNATVAGNPARALERS
jgi:putative colanic acid biosynthesis acetyltransferase WcaF